MAPMLKMNESRFTNKILKFFQNLVTMHNWFFQVGLDLNELNIMGNLIKNILHL